MIWALAIKDVLDWRNHSDELLHYGLPLQFFVGFASSAGLIYNHVFVITSCIVKVIVVSVFQGLYELLDEATNQSLGHEGAVNGALTVLLKRNGDHLYQVLTLGQDLEELLLFEEVLEDESGIHLCFISVLSLKLVDK